MAHGTVFGPGKLTFNPGVGAKELNTLVRSATISPDVKDGDAITYLDGTTDQEDAEITWTLEAEFDQTYDAESFIQWAFDNANTAVPFELDPATTGTLHATGNVKVVPVKMGGDPKKVNTTTLSWRATDVLVAQKP